MDRKEAYAQIKKLNLTEDVKKKFGKNFTQVSTADLVAMIEAASKKSAKSTKEVVKAATGETKKDKVKELRDAMEGTSYEPKYKAAVKAIAKFLACLPEDLLNDAAALAKTLTPEKSVENIDFSSADIDKMFKK